MAGSIAHSLVRHAASLFLLAALLAGVPNRVLATLEDPGICDRNDSICVMWVELRRDEGEVRVSVQVSSPTHINVARKTYAGRVVIDIDGAQLGDESMRLPDGSGVVTRIRAADHADAARIVLDVANPAAARQARVETDGEGFLRIVIDEDAIDEMLDEPVDLTPPATTPADAASAHSRAVELVRLDDLDGALAVIADARRQFPDAIGLIVDEIVMLNWAERHDEALAHAARLADAALPAFAYKALGRSARALARDEAAEFWFRRARRAEPDDPAALAGLAISLADLGHTSEARSMLDSAGDTLRASAVFWMASAYVHEVEGSHLSAVFDYDAALARNPNDEGATRARALALQALMQSDDLTID